MNRVLKETKKTLRDTVWCSPGEAARLLLLVASQIKSEEDFDDPELRQQLLMAAELFRAGVGRKRNFVVTLS